MRQVKKRSTDRPIPVRQSKPNPTVSDSSHLFQLRSLQPLSGLTCYEAEFVHSAIAHPRSLSQGDRRVVEAIYRKHFGLEIELKPVNWQSGNEELELRPMSWQEELEYIETDGGVFEL
jgi:hypothetical protein